MNKFRFIFFSLFVAISLLSCKPDDRYYKLSSEAKELFLFDVNDTFQLKNEETEEVLTFVVSSKTFEDIDDGTPHGMISLGSKAEVYIERGIYKFIDTTNCYEGEAVLLADRDGGFRFYIYLYGCFGNPDYVDEYYNTPLINVNINSVNYYDIYTLEGTHIIYYNKLKGILKIDDKFSIIE